MDLSNRAWIPNLISFLRFPLALAFLSASPGLRTFALLASALSDFLDGFLARRYSWKSRFGTWFDPICDKFFVGFILLVLLLEGTIPLLLALCMLSRDIAVALFAFKLFVQGNHRSYTVEAFFWGKAATFCQFATLLAVIHHIPIPAFVYAAFILIGVLSFLELLTRGNP